VDDPANFTAGNSQGAASSSSGTDGNNTDGQTSMSSMSNGATSTGSVDSSGGTPMTTGPAETDGGNCGNGVIDAGEQCDGADLQGFDCASLGLNGGTLNCDAMMCTFDTSMCSSTTGTSG